MSSPRPKITCVAVTRNRIALLKPLFDAVINQTHPPDEIIVVDNDSSDGTREWICQLAAARRDIRPVLLDKNSGGAGGFHLGLRLAYESGADWIWTLDDDALPEPRALESLLHYGIVAKDETNSDVGFLASQVNWKDGNRHRMNVPGPATDWTSNPGSCSGSARITYASFVSILVNRHAIAKVGLPLKEFFLYFEDVEFTRRITSAGFAAYYVEASKVIHLTRTNQGVTLEELNLTRQELAKWQHIVRNLVAVNRNRELGVLREVARIGYIWAKLIKNGVPMGMQLSLVKAGVQGLFLNYERWIEYPSMKPQLHES